MQNDDNCTTDARATISIQIPEGAESGDELSFWVGGKELSIPVPPQSQAGDILQIKLWEVDDDGSDDRATTAIQLMTGNQLFLVDGAADSKYETSKGFASDGTFLCLWPASRFVIDFMNTSEEFHEMIRQNPTNIRSVLELGAGHGWFGMAFADIVASLSSSPLETMQVVLTDVGDAVDQLNRNIEQNRNIFRGKVQFEAIQLAWHSIHVPLAATTSSIDFILGSDLLYDCSNISHLVATIKRLMSRTTKILLSVRWRKPVEERTFFVALSDNIEWKMIYGDCPLDFRTYGNPAFHASNNWFLQTMVGCGGETVSLSMIDDAALSRMSNAEFEEYERLQTQVYLGVNATKCAKEDHGHKRSKTHS